MSKPSTAGSRHSRKDPGHIPQVPMEWLDAGAWRLPSGKALAEFALQAGFLAPLLFGADTFRPAPRKGLSRSFAAKENR